MANDLPVLICGAGLGGVAAALALAQKGCCVRVLEAAQEPGVIGYGIQLGPNVFRMFRALGVEEAVLSHSHFPPDVLMLDALSGEEVTRVHTGQAFRDRFGDPYVAIHRVDLHRCLLDACKLNANIEISASSECIGFEDDGARVRVSLQDGRVIDGCALIGADGLGSMTRAALSREAAPNPIGYVAHRAVLPWDEAPKSARRDEVILWAGPAYHIVQYPLRAKSLFNVVAVFKTENPHERAGPQAYRDVLMRTYAGAHPAMLEMLELMDTGRRWVIADRDPIRHWSQGRATLLGDAAHPTLQSLAQGAGMAIEDAVVLAECVSQANLDFERAFIRYQRTRAARTARVMLESRALWEVYHLAGAARLERNAAWEARTRGETYERLAWLYDGIGAGAR